MMSKMTEEQVLKELDEALEAPRKDHKIRITTMLDGDILDELKERAAEQKIGYQTLLNSVLREALFKQSVSNNSLSVEAVVEIIESRYEMKKKVAGE